MIGETVSHYRILEKLGHGGMGVVYRAEDLRLTRTVALKFLSTERLDDDAARERFLREARSASLLDHPNICTIFEIDETAQGQLFIAMAFYEGETLRERVDRSPLSTEEALAIVAQVGAGLVAAHSRGIVHRDIKPENLMITSNQVVKILDFGVAKASGADRLTQAGKAMGTTRYMAPEGLRGQAVDRRSDIWSLGVIFYEMLSGHPPFSGESQSELILSVLMDGPAPMAEPRRPASQRIETVIYRALEKEPEDRYGSVLEMLADLQLTPLQSGSRTLELGEPALGPTASPSPVHHRSSIAVLPFADLSPAQDQAYFCHGLAEELMYSMGRVEGLRVASRTSSSQLAAKDWDVRELGRRLNVETVLEGSVRTSADRLRITVQLVKVANGYQLWSERYDRQLADLFEVQDEIARMVVEALKMTLAPRGVSAEGEDPEAYDLYLKGRFHWNQRTEAALEQGIECFEQAIARRPDFARAYGGLADSLAILGVYGARRPTAVMPQALAAAEKALSLSDELAEVYAARACVRATYDWDFAGAVEDFRRAIRRDPNHATSYQWYAMNCLLPQGYFERALVQLERALELDPLSLAINTSIGIHYFYSREFGRAEKEFLKALEIDASFAMAHLFLGRTYEQLKRYPEAVTALERAVELSGGSPEMSASLCSVFAAAGERGKAERLDEELQELAARRWVSPVLLAQCRISLGDQAGALAHLEEALEERAADLIWIGVRPAFDSLRRDPRLQKISRRLGLRNREVSARLLEQSTLEF